MDLDAEFAAVHESENGLASKRPDQTLNIWVETNRRDDEHVNRRDGMLGPEYLKLGQDLQDIDPNSPDGLELARTLAALDRLCK